MKILNEDILDGLTVDLESNFTSKALWVGSTINFSIQAFYTGTPNGAFKLQASNDEGDPSAPTQAMMEAGVTHWTDVEDSSIAVTAAGDLMYNAQDVGYRWVRLVWTDATSGNPSVLTVARFNSKGI